LVSKVDWLPFMSNQQPESRRGSRAAAAGETARNLFKRQDKRRMGKRRRAGRNVKAAAYWEQFADKNNFYLQHLFFGGQSTGRAINFPTPAATGL
jgi:hypothetical protein